MLKHAIKGVLAILWMSFFAAGILPAADWQYGIVDPSGSGDFSSLRIDKYGNAHVAYLDEMVQFPGLPGIGVLKYGFWDRKLQRWFATVVDRGGGWSSLALDSKQYPHISYNDNGNLKYAHWNGSSWQTQVIRVPSRRIEFYTSIALDANDNPSVSYYETAPPSDPIVFRLRVVSWNGEAWLLRVADPAHGSGKFNSMASDSAGKPQIAYANVIYENSSLRYARWNGQSWDVEILEGKDNPVPMHSVALFTDKNDVPHIAYTDASKNLIKYATRRDGKWQIETVDSIVAEGFPDRNAIALDEQGNPYIGYCDAGLRQLKVAHRENQKWVVETVDKSVPCFTPSVLVDQDSILVTYGSRGQQGGLRFARKSLRASTENSALVEK